MTLGELKKEIAKFGTAKDNLEIELKVSSPYNKATLYFPANVVREAMYESQSRIQIA